MPDGMVDLSEKEPFMRKVALTIFALILSTVASPARQIPAAKPQVSDLLAKFHSDEWSDRAEAYEELNADGNAMRSERVKAALLDLQDRENHLTLATAPEPKSEEAYAEYKAQLLSTVVSIINWQDPGQVCLLAHASYNTDSDFAARLATVGKALTPCLTQMIQSGRRGERMKAIAVLIQTGAKAQDVDSGTTQTIRAATLRSLQDADEWFRSSAIESLGDFGGEEMIPALHTVAETDQDASIRKEARNAIAAIQKRNVK
jgi:hypothetical protein